MFQSLPTWLLLGALLVALLAGCQRENPDDPLARTPVPQGTTVLPALSPSPSPSEPDLPDVAPTPLATPEPTAEAPTETPPTPATRFSNLRFAPTGEGQAQESFPAGTERVCAIWDYRDMTAADTIERLWFLNDSLYVERREAWDMAKYGASGTVRDICLYDLIDGYIDGAVDGIDPGTWRVELRLNGEQQVVGEFTVGP